MVSYPTMLTWSLPRNISTGRFSHHGTLQDLLLKIQQSSSRYALMLIEGQNESVFD